MSQSNATAPTRDILRSHGPDAYILALAASFPCLSHKIALLHWTKFDERGWAELAKPWSSGERHAAAFVLNVWDTRTEWRFDLFKAFNTWDDENCAAAQRWLAAPVWPRP